MRNRTTKAERRTAKRGLAAWRAAAWMIAAEIGDRADLNTARRCGVGTMARRLRPRPKPPAPSWIWMRGNVTRDAHGRFTLQADPAGDTAITVAPRDADSGPDEPWASYDRSPSGRRSLTGAYRTLITGTPVRLTPLDEAGRPVASDHNPHAVRPSREYTVSFTMDMKSMDPEALSIMFNLPDRKESTSE